MIIRRLYCSSEVDLNTYLRLSSETLESLNDRFSELIEDHEESTETICRLCIIVERIWSMMMKNGLKAAVCSF